MQEYLDGLELETLKRIFLFNDETVNIFSDASYRRRKGLCSYGAILVHNNDVVCTDIRPMRIEPEDTINSLELKGLRKAIAFAFSTQGIIDRAFGETRKISRINIFTDSQYAVSAVKNYLFYPANWIWDPRLEAYVKPIAPRRRKDALIANQNLIIEVANSILKFQALFPTILLDIWWCPAHVHVTSNREIRDAGNRFKQINSKLPYLMTVDNDFIRYVSESNGKIDDAVRKTTRHKSEVNWIEEPIRFHYSQSKLRRIYEE